ncbi:MAG TPA: methyl-accepting chemotaxis protein, partial [Stellaceae bacterium]|nr:methyl-accepting chemotaxis protein [Stellaceae bacterium]
MFHFSLATLVPMLALIGVVMFERSALEAPFAAALSDQAAQVNETLDRTFFERYGDVQTFAQNPAILSGIGLAGTPGEDENPLVLGINRYMPIYGDYRLMMLVAPDGKLLAVNSVDGTGKPIKTDWLYQESFKDAPWLAKALARDFITGKDKPTGAVVMPPQREPALARVFGDDGNAMVFAAPVTDASGKVIAVWANFYDTASVEEVVAGVYAKLAAHDHASADVFVIDKSGRILLDSRLRGENGARPHFDKLSQTSLIERKVPAALAVAKGEPGWLISTNQLTDIEQVAAYAPGAGVPGFPGLGWSTIINVPTREAFAAVDRILRQMLIASAAIMVISLASGALTGAFYVRPIRRLTDVMTRVAGGANDVPVPGRDRPDELGDMARALEIFESNTRRVAQLLAEQHGAEARAAAERQEAVHALADRFEKDVRGVVTALSAATRQLEANAREVERAIAEAGRQAAQAAGAARQVTGDVQSVAGSAAQLASSFAAIGDQVTRSSAIARHAADGARSTDKTIEGLAGAAQRIGEVVALINDIASQTNLLALNATIEAARAGAAGKGFAVVASEVKALATQTGKATDDIRAQIAAMQGATGEAVAAIRGINGTIEQMSGISDTIAASVDQQRDATRDIATNVAHA